MPDHICVTCKWVKLTDKYPRCIRPTETGPLNELCGDDRSERGQCGKDGQFWEPKG